MASPLVSWTSRFVRELLRRDATAPAIDRLTNLPTRSAIIAQAADVLKRSRFREPSAFVIFDFSNVQDTPEPREGSPNGGLIPGLARLLRLWIPADHVVGHMREREFAVLIHGLRVLEVENLVQAVIQNLRTTEMLGGRQKEIATIVGVSYSSDSDCEVSQFLRNADIALARARSTGRAHYVIVDAIRDWAA